MQSGKWIRALLGLLYTKKDQESQQTDRWADRQRDGEMMMDKRHSEEEKEKKDTEDE